MNTQKEQPFGKILEMTEGGCLLAVFSVTLATSGSGRETVGFDFAIPPMYFFATFRYFFTHFL
jgi:hypothetical protein